MTDPSAFPGPPDDRRPIDGGLIAYKDRLPLGISLLALVVAIVALVLAVSDGDDAETVSDTTSDTTSEQPAPTTATTAIRTTTTLGTVQTLPPTPTTAGGQQVITATTADEAEMVDSEPVPLVLSVVGIAFDSNLNMRDAPGGQVIGSLGSQATGIIPTGTTRSQAGTTWLEVMVNEDVGWVSSDFVAPLGDSVDLTSQVVGALGESPSAATLTALGQLVANALAPAEFEPRIRVSAAPVAGVISGVTVDIVGSGDDSVRGFRLMVFAQTGEGSDGYTLRNVEGTLICYAERGVSADGFCN